VSRIVLAIRDLRLADVRVDAELALHALDDDLEMQLTHPADDRLPGLRIGADAEGRVFQRELASATPILS
jgi:hypothetical protein